MLWLSPRTGSTHTNHLLLVKDQAVRTRFFFASRAAGRRIIDGSERVSTLSPQLFSPGSHKTKPSVYNHYVFRLLKKFKKTAWRGCSAPCFAQKRQPREPQKKSGGRKIPVLVSHFGQILTNPMPGGSFLAKFSPKPARTSNFLQPRSKKPRPAPPSGGNRPGPGIQPPARRPNQRGLVSPA